MSRTRNKLIRATALMGVLASFAAPPASAEETADFGIPTVGDMAKDVGGAVTDSVGSGVGAVVGAVKSAVGAGMGGAKSSEAETKSVQDGKPTTVIDPTLDVGSITSKSSKINSDTAMIKLEQARIQEIKKVVDDIGIENAVSLYPDLGPSLVTSPMALDSQLKKIQTMNKLREEIARANAPTAFEQEQADKLEAKEEKKAKDGEQKVASNANETNLMAMKIDDAGGKLPQNGAQKAADGMTKEQVEALVADLLAQNAPKEEEKPVGQAYLYEVYGANDNYLAVFKDAESVYKLRVGDDAPMGGKIKSISNDLVVITGLDGKDFDVRLR